MVRRFLGCALAVVAGCYAPSYPECAIACTPEKGCPSGLACDGALGLCHTDGVSCSDHPLDARTDGPAHDDAAIDANPLDLDSDGILNLDDNCPMVANHDQADEDDDLIGDACDPCPISNRDSVDSDMDGVPDDCDPIPDTGGDHLIMFAGLGSAPPGAIFTSGWTFSPTSGAAKVTAVGAVAETIRWPLTPGNRTIRASVNITAINSTSTYAGVILDLSNTEAGRTCAVTSLSGKRDLVVSDPSTNTNLGVPKMMGPAALTELRLQHSINDSWTCTSPAAGSAFILITQSPTSGGVYDGIYVRDATIDFNWVMIVGEP